MARLNVEAVDEAEFKSRPRPRIPVPTPDPTASLDKWAYTPARGTDRQQSATVVAQNFKNARWDPEQSLDDTPIRYREKPSLKLDQMRKAPPPSGLVYKYMPKLGG